MEVLPVTGTEHGDGGARLAGAACPAAPVCEALDVLGEGAVNDEVHIGDIKPPGCHVCGHQDAKLAVAEALHHLLPLVLSNVPMQGLRASVPSSGRQSWHVP